MKNTGYIFQLFAGAVYFTQFFALIYFYRKRSRSFDMKEVREPVPFTVLRIIWAFAVISGILLYTVRPGLFQWSLLSLPQWARIGGIILGILSNGCIIWTVYMLGENLSASLSIREGHSPVINGLYRYVRHPLYSSGVLLFLSLLLITDSWIIGAAGIGFQFFIMIFRINTEESMMIEAFGDDYRMYMNGTYRFLPKIPIFRSR